MQTTRKRQKEIQYEGAMVHRDLLFGTLAKVKETSTILYHLDSRFHISKATEHRP